MGCTAVKICGLAEMEQRLCRSPLVLQDVGVVDTLTWPTESRGNDDFGDLSRLTLPYPTLQIRHHVHEIIMFKRFDARLASDLE